MSPRLKRFWAWVVALVGVPLIPAALNGWLHREAVSWNPPAADAVTAANPLKPGEVTMETVHTWDGSILWVDARSEEAFTEGHVPGAVRLTDTEWDDLFGDFLAVWELDARIVVYCSERCDRSEPVRLRLMEDLQIEQVYLLRGGYPAWEAARP